METEIFNNLSDKTNLERAFEDYADALIIFINGYLKDIREAEDIMMDCFVEIICRDIKFDSTNQFRAYLYTCAKNKSLNYLRKNKHLVPLDSEVLIDKEGLESKILKSAKDKKLYEAMKKIKAKYSQVLYLDYILGFSQDEIAKILGVDSRAVKNLKFRAKKKLNQILKQENFVLE